jgi:hypothetical protein
MSWRCDVPPLYDESEIHQAVKDIKPGERIPEQIYVQDYRDGSIPPWTVQECSPCGNGLYLTLIDPTTRHGYGYPANSYVGLDLITMPTRTLAGGLYLYYPGPECVRRRNQFCDVRQEARKIAERLAGERRGAFISKQQDRETAAPGAPGTKENRYNPV